VPLRSLASFGGNNSMRGYYDGRYRDKDQLVFQAEYRIPVYGKWGVVVFGSTGDVSSKFTDYTFGDLKYSYGAGIRFAISKKEKLNLRLDYGIGQGNNNGLYFQLGEAF
jgi:outer membrane translocation and assembly module TamA